MLTYPHFDPVAIQLGPLAIHWYGLMYLVGFVGAWWVLQRRCNPVTGWTRDDVTDYLFYGALGAILGGRIGYMFIYGWDHLTANPLSLFKIWQGGMSFHGGLVGVLIANWYFARRTGRSWYQVGDFIAPVVAIPLGCGRWGNFVNGELWGRPTDLPWGMVFPHVDQLPRHPSQLYELALEGIVLFIVVWWFSSRKRPDGAVMGLFALLYALFRFSVEFLRTPDVQMGDNGIIGLGWLTTGQLLSLLMGVIAAGIIVLAYRRKAAA